jgi:phage repressor protein C with HTH and peptisase S24 domain
MLESQTLTNDERAARITEALRACTKTRTKGDVAELLGVSPQAITGWEKTGRISRQAMAGLALLSGHPIEYFIDRRPQRADEWADVHGYAQAVGLGKGAEAQEYAETHKLKFRAESLARKNIRPAGLAVMYGQGDSMLPRIHPGDAILFDTSDVRARDGAIFVIQWRGEIYAKRALLLDDAVYFSADNPAGDHNWRKPKKLDAKRDPISIIGRVRWIGSWED